MAVFYLTEWRDGKLYVADEGQSYRCASDRDVIDHLLDENQHLKDMIGTIRDMVETVA